MKYRLTRRQRKAEHRRREARARENRAMHPDELPLPVPRPAFTRLESHYRPDAPLKSVTMRQADIETARWYQQRDQRLKDYQRNEPDRRWGLVLEALADMEIKHFFVPVTIDVEPDYDRISRHVASRGKPPDPFSAVDHVLTISLTLPIKDRDTGTPGFFRTVVQLAWVEVQRCRSTRELELLLLTRIRTTLRDAAEHEADESILFRGVRIFDPHATPTPRSPR